MKTIKTGVRVTIRIDPETPDASFLRLKGQGR